MFKMILKEKYLPSPKIGQALFNQLIGYKEFLLETSKEFKLLQYKYFTAMILDLVKATKNYGSPIDFAITELKLALSKDISLETKIRSQLFGAIFQMIMISLMGFLFFYFSSIQLGLKIAIREILICFLIQFFGLSIFILLFIKLKTYHFKDLESYLKSIYKLRSLSVSGFGISKVLRDSNLSNLPKKKKLFPLYKRILTIFKMVQKYGSLDTQEFNIIIAELWQLCDIEFEHFLKHLAALKTVIIIGFFLGTYLYLIFNLLAGLQL